MLDLRANVITPGAVLVLGVGPGVIAAADGQSVAGVPLSPIATLVGWGMIGVTANTIARIRLQSQDQVDPINGVDYAPGATSVVATQWAWDNLKYKTGQRIIQAGTNTAQGAATSLLLDLYPGGSCIAGSETMGGKVITAVATTFGAALVANAWGVMPYAPGQPLPNGKYAILGATATAHTNFAAMRFSHTDFKGFKPGFPLKNCNLTSAAVDDLGPDDGLFSQGSKSQFVYMSRLLGVPCCPVFTVGNAGTGLTIEMIGSVAATPVVTIFLAKVG
jgi:hypothetical protein